MTGFDIDSIYSAVPPLSALSFFWRSTTPSSAAE
jgi:hypothetical protein